METLFVELKFDDKELGPGWMNIDNLKNLLFTETATKPELLSVKITEWIENDKPESEKTC